MLNLTAYAYSRSIDGVILRLVCFCEDHVHRPAFLFTGGL